MAKTVTVELVDPIVTHQGDVMSLMLKEPTAGDYFALGDPYQIAKSADGTLFTVEKDEVILAYAERGVQAPVDAVMLAGTSLANAIRIREGVLGFFAAARART
jgi:hypothetical protein